MTLMDILHQVVKETSPIKVTPQAKKGIMEFIETMDMIQIYLQNHTATETVETLVKKIKYREYLIKEEGSETAADEKYENVGQIINMAEKYTER
ncbi:MAG: hypothetical protein WCJ45_05345 [bacterium]